MNKEINENNMNEVANHAVSIINKHFSECEAKQMLIKHLGIFKSFEMNMCAISLAMGNIRSLAQTGIGQYKKSEEYIEALKKIEVIADNLHNVGGFLIRGEDCDAMHLYLHGRDKNWPNGISKNSENLSLKFFPNPSNTIEKYKEILLTDEEIAKISNKEN